MVREGAIRVWLNDELLADSAVVWPESPALPKSLPVTIRPPLLTRDQNDLRIEARDAAGNVAAKTASFRVADGSVPLLTVHGNFPNPFHADGTIIAFSLSERAEEVRLSIYDVAGRLVIRGSNYDLSQFFPDDPAANHRDVEGRLSDSRGYQLEAVFLHELAWSGRDRHGVSVANGVYLSASSPLERRWAGPRKKSSPW